DSQLESRSSIFRRERVGQVPNLSYTPFNDGYSASGILTIPLAPGSRPPLGWQSPTSLTLRQFASFAWFAGSLVTPTSLYQPKSDLKSTIPVCRTQLELNRLTSVFR